MPIAIETASDPWRPVHLDGLALDIVVWASILSFLSALLVSLRIYVRVTIQCFGIDDWFMCFGTIIALLHNAAAIWGAISGLGTVDALLNLKQSIEANKAILMWEITISFAFGFVKTSICCALMRLAVQRPYRVVLWILITTTWAMNIWEVVAIATAYDQRTATCVTGPDPGCSNAEAVAFICLQFAVYITVDAACTICPILLLWNLQMSTRAKISTALLLGLGSLATFASIVRLPLSLKINYINDRLYHRGRVVIWAVVEINVGIIAGSMPAIRKLFKWVAEDFLWNPKTQRGIQGNNYNLGALSQMMGRSGPTRLRTPNDEATSGCGDQDIELSHGSVHLENIGRKVKGSTAVSNSETTNTTLELSRNETLVSRESSSEDRLER